MNKELATREQFTQVARRAATGRRPARRLRPQLHL